MQAYSLQNTFIMLASTNQKKGLKKFLSRQLSSDHMKKIRGGTGNNDNNIHDETTQIVVQDIIDL